MILPATTVFGALLPLTIDLLIAGNTEDSSQVAGFAYAINTFGSICGSCIAGLVLIPVFGSSAAITVSVLGLSSAALYLSVTVHMPKHRSIELRSLRHFLPLAALVVFSLFSSNISFKNIIKSAYFQASVKGQNLSEVMRFYTKDHENFKLIVEGETAITSLSHDKSDGEGYQSLLRLKTNGLNESLYDKNNLDSIPKYEGLLGMLPFVFNRNPHRAFVVGYGGGYTVDLLTSLDIPNVYVAELERGIIEAANYVYDGKNPVLARANLNLKIGDARFVLAGKLYEKFDVIVSQPSHSWLTGVANLFTKEFFEIVQGNLTEKGIYSQWLNLYNMDKKVLRSILKTFYTVFPYGHVFTNVGDEELIMLGSNSPLKVDLDRLDALTSNPVLKRKLEQLPFDSASSFLTNFAVSREDLWHHIDDAPLNTDINVFAESNQSHLFYRSEQVDNPAEYVVSKFTGDFQTALRGKLSTEVMYLVAQDLYASGKTAKYAALLDRVQKKGSDTVFGDEQLGYLSYLAGNFDKSLGYFKAAFGKKASSYNLNRQIQVYVGMGKSKKALKIAAKHKNLQDKNSSCYLASARFELGILKESHLNKLRRNLPRLENPCVVLAHKILGLAYLDRRNSTRAVYHLENPYKKNQVDTGVLRGLSAAYMLSGHTKRGIEFAEYLKAIEPAQF